MAGSQFSSLSTPRHDEIGRFKQVNRVERSVTVRTERLESALRRLSAAHHFRRPFLKLDTQGFDATIVAAGRDVMHRFVGLQSELAVKKLYAHSMDYREALTIYEQCGFELSAFVANNEGHFPRMMETDCIMIRADLVGG